MPPLLQKSQQNITYHFHGLLSLESDLCRRLWFWIVCGIILEREMFVGGVLYI